MTQTFYIKKGDTEPPIRARLTDTEDRAIDLSGSSVTLRLIEPRGGETFFEKDVEITSEANGIVTYRWDDGDTDVAGRKRGEFTVTYSDGGVETFPNVGYYEFYVEP